MYIKSMVAQPDRVSMGTSQRWHTYLSAVNGKLRPSVRLPVSVTIQMKSPTGPIAGVSGTGLLQYRNRQSLASASQRATGDNRIYSTFTVFHFNIRDYLKHDIRVHESKHNYAGSPLSGSELREMWQQRFKN